MGKEEREGPHRKEGPQGKCMEGTWGGLASGIRVAYFGAVLEDKAAKGVWGLLSRPL